MLLPLLKSLRLWQWPKNLFVLAPLVFAEGLSDPALVVRGLLAFAFFSVSSSAVYLVNDLLDLPFVFFSHCARFVIEFVAINRIL